MSDSTFRTAVVRIPGGPESIEVIEVPVVEPGPGEIRVRIAAASVNPVDLGVAEGFFHGMGLINQPERTGLGWDFAGTVVATGPGVDLAVGTEVAGLVAGFDRDFGTYAELIVVPAADVAVVPDGLDLVEAATMPLNGLTAAQILDLLGSPAADGNRLLVTVRRRSPDGRAFSPAVRRKRPTGHCIGATAGSGTSFRCSRSQASPTCMRIWLSVRSCDVCALEMCGRTVQSFESI
jgi:D-arabinose 1-dehydrogenase-like Zn-dependent alcohol dehydrogenase